MSANQAEFGEERRKQRISALIPRIRVSRGELTGEIILDRRDGKIVHCVVQRQGSKEVLFLEQFYTRADAEAAVEKFMSTHSRKRPRAKGSASAK